MEWNSNENSIVFWFKELLLILFIILWLFSIWSMFVFKESTKIYFYTPMNDIQNIANETKDTQFKIRSWNYDNVINDWLSPLSKSIKDNYYLDLNKRTEKVISSWDINNCYNEFSWNYEKAYYCLQSYSSNVNYIKNNVDILTDEMKSLYDIQSCSYTTNYDDFNICMKKFAYEWENFYKCLIFKEDELQQECFDFKWFKFLSQKWMLEFLNIEQKKSKLLFNTETNWKIIRKKITSGIVKDHPELLFKYRIFSPNFENFNELKSKHPELFNNKNFLQSLSDNKITYEN